MNRLHNSVGYKKTTSFLILLMIQTLVMLINVPAYSQAKRNEESFTLENYYRVKWGYAEEFLRLYKKNHYPLLKKALEKGDILAITIEKPRLHESEESRWDYKIRITFKNVQTAYDTHLTDPYKKQLYPDLSALEKEEQHRFELLTAHWDVAVQTINPE